MTSSNHIIKRRASRLWVKREQVTVSFTRDVRVQDGKGGWRKTGEVTIAPQKFRMAATARQHDMDSTTVEGEVQGADWLLISDRVNADVQEHDRFHLNGRWWRVRFVDQNQIWRTAAGVVEHGTSS